jgi:hypothetical protein
MRKTKSATKHATKPAAIVNYSERLYKDYDYNAKKYAQVIPEYSENIESFVLPKTRKVKSKSETKPLKKAETKPIKPESMKKPKPRKPERKPQSRKQKEINLNTKTRIQERKEENQTKAKYVTTRIQARKVANQTRKAANMTADEKRKELQKRIQERKEKDQKGQGTRM